MACSTGTCHTATIDDLDLKDSAHPNVAPFSGTLLLLDEPSDQAPHGSDGHQILVPKEVAQERLKTLPGMGINYQADLTGHNPAKKVGVITEASVDGNKVTVKGLVWKKDFPEAVRVFKANKGRLGMSMELGDVYVRDKDERVWHLQDFHFTGATVLLKNHAAYESTDLAASRYFVSALAAAREAGRIFNKGGSPEMAKEKDSKEVKSNSGAAFVAAIQSAVETGIANALKKQSDENKAGNDKIAEALTSLSASQQELVKGMNEIALHSISAATDTEDVDGELVEVEAAGDGIEADATDATGMAMSKGDATDATDASDVEADADATNYHSDEQGDGATPGDLNPDASSHAHSQARSGAGDRATKAGGKSVDRGIAAGKAVAVKSMAAARVIHSLKAQNKELRDLNTRLSNKVTAIQASLDRYADRVERRSLAPEVSALLEKNGYDVRELMGNRNSRLSVNDVDTILANAGVPLEPVMRASIKNQLLQNGLMEQGEIRRN